MDTIKGEGWVMVKKNCAVNKLETVLSKKEEQIRYSMLRVSSRTSIHCWHNNVNKN